MVTRGTCAVLDVLRVQHLLIDVKFLLELWLTWSRVANLRKFLRKATEIVPSSGRMPVLTSSALLSQCADIMINGLGFWKIETGDVPAQAQLAQD